MLSLRLYFFSFSLSLLTYTTYRKKVKENEWSISRAQWVGDDLNKWLAIKEKRQRPSANKSIIIRPQMAAHLCSEIQSIISLLQNHRSKLVPIILDVNKRAVHWSKTNKQNKREKKRQQQRNSHLEFVYLFTFFSLIDILNAVIIRVFSSPEDYKYAYL